jgi:uncharacterized protein (TIGR03118 family)
MSAKWQEYREMLATMDSIIIFGFITFFLIFIICWSFCTDANNSIKIGTGCCNAVKPCLRRLNRSLSSSVPDQAKSLNTGAKNTWGIAQSHCSTNTGYAYEDPSFWNAQNGFGTITLNGGMDGGLLETVLVPPAAGGSTGSPSGIVTLPANNPFLFSDGVSTGAAYVIIVTEDGTIAAYNPEVDPVNAITVLDASTDGKVFKGCTIMGSELFVANFFNGVIEVYDSQFSLVRSFTDNGLLSNGFSPHNLLALHPFSKSKIAVVFAAADVSSQNAVPGVGSGYVDIFDATSGSLYKRLVNQGVLNAPYGLAQQRNSNVLFVGNWGDGLVHSYNLLEKNPSKSLIGPLIDTRGNRLVTDGLYGLTINSVYSDSKNRSKTKNKNKNKNKTIMYCAGPSDGSAGLFGSFVCCS